MSFDKWYREVGYLGDDQNTRVKIAYEAGQQSKQDEVDELQLKLSEDSRVLHNVIDIERRKCEELQKRIDEAMKYVSESPLKDVSRRAMINFMDILKGNTSEN